MKDMLAGSDEGVAARAQYLDVARGMKAYEDALFDGWLASIDGTLAGYLKRTILVEVPSDSTASSSPSKGSGTGADEEEASVRAALSGSQLAGSRYTVNFAVELQQVITEAKYLEQLGFQIPELARNVALQEDKYVTYVDGLKRTLERYDETLASLNAPETELLGDHVRELQRVLKPGAKRLNWSSLGIGDYIARCDLAITKMESLVNQIHKNAHDIELRLKLVEQADLFRAPPPGPGGMLPEAKVRKSSRKACLVKFLSFRFLIPFPLYYDFIVYLLRNILIVLTPIGIPSSAFSLESTTRSAPS